MRESFGGLLYFAAFLWYVWSFTFAGLTVFLYLGTGPDAWDGHLAYAVSAVGLIPIIGGIVATFMSDAVHGWGVLHALVNFLGYIPLAIIAAMIASTGDQAANEGA